MSELLNDRVRWAQHNGIVRITLAGRPGNPLDVATAQALVEACHRAAEGAAAGSVRVVVLAAEGPRFSVGGDLTEFATATDRSAQVRAAADELHRAILGFITLPAPVVSVIHGTVAGGGVGIALSGDVVVMANEARLQLAYTAAALSPDCGATWTLTRRLGAARTLDLALTNRALSGAEAAAWGVVSRAVPAAQLAESVERIVADLAAGPTATYAETKRLVGSAWERPLSHHLDEESATIGRLIVSANGVEGIDAFLEKRQPQFS